MDQSTQHLSSLGQVLMKTIFYVGVSLISISVVLLASDLIGLIDIKQLFHLEGSPLKTYARIAVSGCLLASIGSLQPKFSNEDNNTP
jgi:hypothetical protein